MSQRVNGAALYDQLKSRARGFVEHHLSFLCERGFLEPGNKVLDIGCGTGLETVFFGQVIGPEGEVVGIDLSEPMLEVARERAKRYELSNTKFTRRDRDKLKFPHAFFDSLICIYSLTDGEDYNCLHGDIQYNCVVKKRLQEFKEVLHQGGKIFLSMPLNHQSQECMEQESERIHRVIQSAGFDSSKREHVSFSDKDDVTRGSLIVWGEK